MLELYLVETRSEDAQTTGSCVSVRFDERTGWLRVKWFGGEPLSPRGFLSLVRHLGLPAGVNPQVTMSRELACISRSSTEVHSSACEEVWSADRNGYPRLLLARMDYSNDAVYCFEGFQGMVLSECRRLFGLGQDPWTFPVRQISGSLHIIGSEEYADKYGSTGVPDPCEDEPCLESQT